MILYRKRDFGALLSDSFQFFKIYGKNYFKNYLSINGGLLILLLLLIGVGYKDIIMQVFGSNMQGQTFFFEEYFAQNTSMLVIVSILVFFLLFLLNIVNLAFPVIYMQKVAEDPSQRPTVNDMVTALKEKLGRITIYALLSFLLFTPLFVIALGISAVLIFLIIGVFLLIVIIPVSTITITLTLFDYLNTENSYFTSLGNGFRYMFSKNFWKYIGNAIVTYLIIQAIASIFTIIPVFLLGASMASGSVEGNNNTYIVILTVVTYALSIMSSLIMSNLLYVNIGLMYYDSREDLQREAYFDEIDTIGKNV